MESINTFSNGMNSDISKTIHSKDSYLQALNFRGVTNLGDSNGSLVNIKGNDLNIVLPNLLDSYKLIVAPTGLGTLNGDVDIVINGQTTTLSVSAGTTGFTIYTALKTLSNCYETTNSTPTTATFAVSYVNNYVVIYQTPNYVVGSGVPSPITITVTLNNPLTATTSIKFVNTIGVNVTTQTPYVVGSTDLIIVGSTYIDEDIYLFSAVDDDTEDNPHLNDSFSNLGVIWKLSINDSDRVSTLTLIYANALDLTKYYPIAPSAALGRYESRNNQRLYWTDFYNSIKTLQVTDEQLFALNPALTSVFPSVTFELPLLKSFTGGSLQQGTYELSYRLKKDGGQISNYSQTSNMISLLGNETGAFISYEGPNGIGNSGRGIVWSLNNMDTSWDTVEFIVIYRATKTDYPTIYVAPSQNIISGVTFDYTLTTVTGFDEILLEEFLSLSTGFTHAKTVETKDNILFWGNVKSIKQKEISNKFDARAFRAKTPGGQDIILTNTGVTTTYNFNNVVPPDPLYAPGLPKTEDCINSYYDSNGDIDSNACYYKPNTHTLGGAGKFISYEFGTEQILLTELASTQGPSNDYNIQTTVPFGYKSAIVNTENPIDLILGTTDSDDQLYPISGVGTTKNPYFTSVQMSVQQEEIYRYGIQFFDLQGGLYFTEWIGDIKIPGYTDNNTNRTQLAINAGITDFRNSFIYNGSIYGQTVYIKFTVDISAIAENISAYQIVRVERDNLNKTILGNGMLTNIFKDNDTDDKVLGGGLKREFELFPNTALAAAIALAISTPTPINIAAAAALTAASTGIPYYPYPSEESLETLCQQDGSINNLTISNKMLTFDCFDFQTNGYSYQSGDKILVRSKVSPVNYLSGSNPRYRIGFDHTALGEFCFNNQTKGTQPSHVSPFFNGTYNRFQTGFDSQLSPSYLLFYVDDTIYSSTSLAGITDRVVSEGLSVNAGSDITTMHGNFKNSMRTYGSQVDNSVPGDGSDTVILSFEDANNIPSYTLYGCRNGQKLMGLYYRPNVNQYGGNTYSARTNNEYIACGSLIPVQRDNQVLQNNKNVTFKCYGGDIFINYWDHQKISKTAAGTDFRRYTYGGGGNPGVGNSLGTFANDPFRISNTYYFPCTNTNNQAVRYGYHIDTSLVDDSQYSVDEFNYNPYHSNEKTITRFIPKPLGFIVNDEWRNRIYYSNVKIDNELQDSWSVYPIDQFYDVEGNYGGINCLIALNQNIYFLQDKGVGVLMINPVSSSVDSQDFSIVLGSATGITKHYYKSIDSGTKHQWSVYRSQSSISFIDIRQRKILLFNGEQVVPISDIKGQRGFLNKRLHNVLFNYDNPIIGKGLLTTYDYQNNEFLYTFKNNNSSTTNDENLTLAYSELQGNFVSMFSFNPNLYINNNRYLLSVVNTNKNNIYLHNFGEYCKFYNTLYPSTLKLIINDNPLYTKVFDNMIIMSEAINDNLEWSDDLNIYPGSATNPNYPDDVINKDSTFNSIRCYNQYQNTDWNTLTITPPNNNIRKVEQGFNIQLPRNKFDYDTYSPSVYSIFDSSKLTKSTFGERLRDKWLIADLKYDNLSGLRFIIHNIKTLLRISDR